MLLTTQVYAQGSGVVSASLFNFQFNHLSNINNNDHPLFSSDHNFTSNQVPQLINENYVDFSQYDATWLYSFSPSYSSKSNNINFDLGVTLRHLSGTTNSAIHNVYFQKTLPLLYGSAIFHFPLKGLSARIEGNHLDLSDTQFFDYKAKLSYEWRNGFGMQGGWQHQQFSLDSVNKSDALYESNGPYIDFYLNF